MLRLLFLSLFASALAANPAVKFDLATSSLRYLTDVGVAAIENNLKDVAVPDVESSPGFIEYGLNKIKMTAFKVNFKDVNVNAVPGSGVVIDTNKAYIGLNGDYHFKFGPGIHETGHIDIQMSDFAVSLKMHFGMAVGPDGKGRLSISTSDCKASAHKVALQFSGSFFNKFINLFRELIDLSMKGKIAELVCEQVKEDVDNKLDEKLRKLNYTIPLMTTGIALDLALTRSPIIKAESMEVDLLGQTDLHDRLIVVHPQPLPQCPMTGRMFNFVVEEAMPNALLEAVVESGLVDLTINSALLNKFKPGAGSFLNITCDTTWCLGALFPPINKKFGDTLMVVGIKRGVTSPNITFTKAGNTAVVNLDFNFNFQSQFPNNSIIPIFDIDLTVGVIMHNVSLTTVNDTEYLLFIDGLDVTQPHTTLNSINVDNVTAEGIEGTFQFAIPFAVGQYITPMVQKGIKIPVNGMFQFRDTIIDLFDRAMYLGFNARITL